MSKCQILAVAVLSLLSLRPAAPDSPADFAGTWQGRFKGTVFCVLKIQAGESISGTLSPGNVTADDEGNVTDAEPSSPDATFPILNPQVDGKTLRFEWRESGDTETLRFEFTITSDNEGELRLLGEEGIKPIHLERAS